MDGHALSHGGVRTGADAHVRLRELCEGEEGRKRWAGVAAAADRKKGRRYYQQLPPARTRNSKHRPSHARRSSERPDTSYPQARSRVDRAGAVDLAHPAHADLGGDFVRAEAGTGSQGQTVGV